MAHAVLAIMTMAGGEWEAALSEARTAFELNPNSAFVIAILGRELKDNGYYDEAMDQLCRALRASPHDPLAWLWKSFLAHCQFCLRDFAAALETLRQVIQMRPGHTWAHEYLIASLGYLGRLDEAREALARARSEFPEYFQRYRQKPRWRVPKDWEMLREGLRLAAGEDS